MRKMPHSCFIVASLVLTAGCGGSHWRMNDRVEGTVKMNGAPLANVVVQFVPDSGTQKQAPKSTGYTDEKGHYSLKCDNGRSGAVIGPHNVVILAGRCGDANGNDRDEMRQSTPRVFVPSIYTMAAKTPLKTEVKADEHNYDLNLTGQR